MARDIKITRAYPEPKVSTSPGGSGPPFYIFVLIFSLIIVSALFHMRGEVN